MRVDTNLKVVNAGVPLTARNERNRHKSYSDCLCVVAMTAKSTRGQAFCVRFLMDRFGSTGLCECARSSLRTTRHGLEAWTVCESERLTVLDTLIARGNIPSQSHWLY